MAAAKTPRVQLVLRVQGEERAAEPQLRVLQATAGARAERAPLPLNRSLRQHPAQCTLPLLPVQTQT